MSQVTLMYKPTPNSYEPESDGKTRQPCATFWQWLREKGHTKGSKPQRRSAKRSSDAPPPPVIGLKPPTGDVVQYWHSDDQDPYW
ncbi:MAG: hypothetical protein GC159_16935 [Phycisphaera sp.]|nr:hypothetical protein [Phycisphaera sp.]